MSRIACSHAGKFGDLLWSLATVREISRKLGEPVDFYTMPEFSSILPVVQQQDYIAEVKALEDWIRTDDNPGAQPWQHPKLPKVYEHEFALGYKGWPEQSLIDAILYQTNLHYGLDLKFDDPIPFLTSPTDELKVDICFGFSSYYDSQKSLFIQELINKIGTKRHVSYVDVSLPVTWEKALGLVGNCKVFVGDKSSLHVLAHGLGKPVVETESNKDRRTFTFQNPYSKYWTAEVDNILDGLDIYSAAIESILNETYSS